MLPVAGEALDVVVLLDDEASTVDKGIASASLAANAVTLGLLPNFGAVHRSGSRAVRDLIADTGGAYVPRGARGGTQWRPGPNDLDWRGSARGVREAVDEAFRRTGVPRAQFQVTRWGRDGQGKSFPVEWRARGGAEVNIDIGHARHGPGAPHVGYQTPGRRGSGGAKRGHILLDHVPVNR
jgi:hypothetical protein